MFKSFKSLKTSGIDLNGLNCLNDLNQIVAALVTYIFTTSQRQRKIALADAHLAQFFIPA